MTEKQEIPKEKEEIPKEKETAKYKNLLNRPVTVQKYFHGHKCHLDPEQLSAYYIKITNPFIRFLFDFITIRINDYRALNMYRSYATLCIEKYRHYKFYTYAIHPFSKLRFYLELICVVVMIVLGSFLAAYYSKVDSPLKDYYTTFMIFCDVVYIINIAANFFTGFIEGQSRKFVVLDLNRIVLYYIKTWLIVDVLSLVSFIPTVCNITADPAITALLEGTKFLRMLSTVTYLKNILHGLGATMSQKTAVEILFYMIIYLTWNIYIQFCAEYAIEGTYYPKDPRYCSWLTYGKLWNETWCIKFFYAANRGVGMLTTNTNMNVMEDDRYKQGCFGLFFIAAWLISKFLVAHFALKYIMVLFGTESARAKYYIMQKQVQHYMKQRKFPPRLMKNILNFYTIRFQSNFFTESHMLRAMTGQLREDLLMHRVQQVVQELAFLKLLPRTLLMQVIFKLKVVIFIAGDIIFKINTIGDCLYFIDKGTVATYSDSGQEISHFEDGDFFGSISLFMPHHFRTCSAVAVTNCELYRLDNEDIDNTIAHCPNALDTIKKVAMSRYENACVLDEHHKADLKAAEMMEYIYGK